MQPSTRKAPFWAEGGFVCGTCKEFLRGDECCCEASEQAAAAIDGMPFLWRQPASAPVILGVLQHPGVPQDHRNGSE